MHAVQSGEKQRLDYSIIRAGFTAPYQLQSSPKGEQANNFFFFFYAQATLFLSPFDVLKILWFGFNSGYADISNTAQQLHSDHDAALRPRALRRRNTIALDLKCLQMWKIKNH